MANVNTKTSLVTINAVGDPEEIVATIYCRRIDISEDESVAGWPTVEYQVKGCVNGSEWITKAPGRITRFERIDGQPSFAPGDVIALIQTTSGSSTFQQVEA